MRKLLNTLFITSEQAYLTLDGETVCVEIQKKKVGQFPLHTLEGIISFLIMEQRRHLWEPVQSEESIFPFSIRLENFSVVSQGNAEEMCCCVNSSIGFLIIEISVALLLEISFSEKCLIVGGQLTEHYGIMN